MASDPDMPFRLHTARLRLRPWTDKDFNLFRALHAEPASMADYGYVLNIEVAERKFQHYVENFKQNKLSRWILEDASGEFLGYTGLAAHISDHPLGPHVDIGWRLMPQAWGYGYASEAAVCAIKDGFERLGLTQIYAYTAADNLRSQAVMQRLGLERREDLDFTKTYPRLGEWRGKVWVITP